MEVSHPFTPRSRTKGKSIRGCAQVLPEGPPVDLRRRAEHSLQSQLGPPAAEVQLPCQSRASDS